ncbi:MAG: hypothetical protein AB8B97_27895 [Granulosicoccus sp.]
MRKAQQFSGSVTMGYAAEKVDGVTARRRPGKVLRHNGRHACNLSAFESVNSRHSRLNSSLQKAISESGERVSKPEQRENFGSHPSGQMTADGNPAIVHTTTTQPLVSRNLLTMIILGCLSVGVLVGYTVSSNTRHNQMLIEPVVIANPQEGLNTPRRSAQVAEEAGGILTIDQVPASTATALTPTENSTESQSASLDEINWLASQNKDLKSQVESLTRESLDLNNELLQLELEAAALRLASEPLTETRTVYNFINVPIGGATNTQGTQSSSPVTNTSVVVEPSTAKTASRQGLPLNTPQAQQQYLDDEQYLDEDDYLEDEQYLDEEDYLEDEQYLDEDDYLEDEQYLDEDDYPEEEDYLSGRQSWEQYKRQRPIDNELSFDQETGFYVNGQYINYETRNETVNGARTYPPARYR